MKGKAVVMLAGLCLAGFVAWRSAPQSALAANLPASVDTPAMRASYARNPDPEAAKMQNMKRHPLARIGTPEEVAELALFLASDRAGWITGGIFPIDGGARVTRR